MAKDVPGSHSNVIPRLLREVPPSTLLRNHYIRCQESTSGPIQEEPEHNYEDAPFGIFVRFGGGRGGLWFRYKGHVRYAACRSHTNMETLTRERERGREGERERAREREREYINRNFKKKPCA